MFCKDCGTELVNGACPNCVQASQESESFTHVEEKPKKTNLVLAIICMATGIASIVWGLGLFGGLAALITGSIYKKQTGESHTMVKVGTACGIVGIILWALLIVACVLYYIIYLLVVFGLLILIKIFVL